MRITKHVDYSGCAAPTRQPAKRPRKHRSVEQRGRPWSADDTAFLRKSWGRIPVEEIASALKRKVGSVNHRAAVLELGRPEERGL